MGSGVEQPLSYYRLYRLCKFIGIIIDRWFEALARQRGHDVGVRTVQLTKIIKSMKNKFKRSFSDDIHEDQLDHPYENQGKTKKKILCTSELETFFYVSSNMASIVGRKFLTWPRGNQGGRISMRFATNIIQRWAFRFFAHFVLSSATQNRARERKKRESAEHKRKKARIGAFTSLCRTTLETRLQSPEPLGVRKPRISCKVCQI
jgi:hypothetical protein